MNKSVYNDLIEVYKECGLVGALHRVFGTNIKVRIGYSKSACNVSIDEMYLSVRSHNALRRAGIQTIGDLIEWLNEGTLKNIRNLGAKSFREIQTKILVYGFERLSEKEKEEFFCDLAECNSG